MCLGAVGAHVGARVEEGEHVKEADGAVRALELRSELPEDKAADCEPNETLRHERSCDKPPHLRATRLVRSGSERRPFRGVRNASQAVAGSRHCFLQALSCKWVDCQHTCRYIIFIGHACIFIARFWKDRNKLRQPPRRQSRN